MTHPLRGDRATTLIAVGLIVLLLAVAVVTILSVSSGTRVTAYFAQTPGLYEGDQVRVLGVEVGSVDEITPLPGEVRVDMTVESDQPIPADPQAAIVAASLVSGRYVQLAPVYRGGPELQDGATIPLARTAVPVEWDQFKDQVTALTRDLGPAAPGDTRGALNQFLDTASANLRGNGPLINTTIKRLSDAVTTVSDGRQDLFATVRNLQLVTSALRDSDLEVATFNRQLAQVSQVLDDNGSELATALTTFDRVAPRIQDFVASNRSNIDNTVRDLTRVTDNLRDNRQDIADLLQRAPTTVANFNNIYDQTSGTLTGALALTNFADPAQFFCSIFFAAAGSAVGNTGPTDPVAFNFCRATLGPLGQILAQNNIPLNVPTIFGPQPLGPGSNR